MKQITDEDIEKAARRACDGIEDEDQLMYALKDFKRGAKWVRDQQPKLKTLEDFGWSKNNYASTPIGKYEVWRGSLTDMFFWRLVDRTSCGCDSIDHGKQLAQADYEKRVNELYV